MTMDLTHLSKRKIIEAALDELRIRRDQMAALAENTRKDAVHEESRPENDKDTRGLEASYLARGQAQRVAELRDDMSSLTFMDLPSYEAETPISLGALVELEDEDEVHNLIFLAPRAGGLEVEEEGHRVRLITPSSPLGRALVDKVEGDEVLLRLKGKVRELLILAVV